MELKTKVQAENGRQELFITRDFDLPLDQVFLAHSDAAILSQWMGTQVLQLDQHSRGAYLFETTDPKGNKHRFSGTIHEFSPQKRIVRTFEMEQSPFGPQLEFLDFEAIDDQRSRLTMHVVYRSVAIRDQILQLPFVQGINMAHQRLEQCFNQQ